jgi:hypothetical protein
MVLKLAMRIHAAPCLVQEHFPCCTFSEHSLVIHTILPIPLALNVPFSIPNSGQVVSQYQIPIEESASICSGICGDVVPPHIANKRMQHWRQKRQKSTCNKPHSPIRLHFTQVPGLWVRQISSTEQEIHRPSRIYDTQCLSTTSPGGEYEERPHEGPTKEEKNNSNLAGVERELIMLAPDTSLRIYATTAAKWHDTYKNT